MRSPADAVVPLPPRTVTTPPSLPPPELFRDQVEQVRTALADPRRGVEVAEVPGPRRLAPHAVAFTAEVAVPAWGHGRFVLLHDPDRDGEWGGPTRVVVHAAAEVEADLGADPLLAGVAWRWLVEALERHGAQAVELGGTVSRQASVRFGRLEEDEGGEDGEVEVRASWTPGTDDDVGEHAAAWLELLADAVGLPPDGVTVLRPGG